MVLLQLLFTFDSPLWFKDLHGQAVLDRRGITGSNYRFGYNGKEHDDDMKGTDNSYDYGMRVYDPRLGRFMSIDPIASKFPYYSPYVYAGDKPIVAKDLDGLEDVWIHVELKGGKEVSTSTLVTDKDPAVAEQQRVDFAQEHNVPYNGNTGGVLYTYNNQSEAGDKGTQQEMTQSVNNLNAKVYGTKNLTFGDRLTKIGEAMDAFVAHHLTGNSMGEGEGHSDAANEGSGGKQAPLPVKIIANINPIVSATNIIVTVGTYIQGNAQDIYGEKATLYGFVTNLLSVGTGLGPAFSSSAAVAKAAEKAEPVVWGIDAVVTAIEQHENKQNDEKKDVKKDVKNDEKKVENK